MRFLPHLVEVNEKYRSKGFEIIMATDVDSVPALEKFVSEKKLTLGVARVPDVYKLLAARGYPTSYAIDVDGNCIWRGHPQGLNESLVEQWLKDLRKPEIPRTLDRKLGKAVNAYDAGDYGKALEAAEEVAKKEKRDEAIAADADYLLGLLNGRLEMLKARAKKYENDGYHDRLFDLLDECADEFKGHDFGDDCERDARKVKRSADYKRCVEARDELARLQERLERMKAEDALEALEDFQKDHKRTPYAAHAAGLARQLKAASEGGTDR